MAINLIESVAKNLGYPIPQKVDPNINEPKETKVMTPPSIAQGAIPAVCAALFKLSRSEEGSQRLLAHDSNMGWLNVLYEDKEREAVDKLAQYGGVSSNQAAIIMEKIAEEAVSEIKQSLGDRISTQTVKGFMGDQHHNILVYLPAVLQMGYLLNDNTMDDRTNKMEGPISSFMHKIEDKMSGRDT